MQKVEESVTYLLGKFARARRGRSLVCVGEEMDVHRNTLEKFVQGKDVSYKVLMKIEAWCDGQE